MMEAGSSALFLLQFNRLQAHVADHRKVEDPGHDAVSIR